MVASSSQRFGSVTSQRPLMFSVELRMGLLPPHRPSFTMHNEWLELLAGLRYAIQSAGIPDCTIKSKIDNDFRTWCITENCEDQYSFDIVSPKLLYHHRDSWTRLLSRVYDIVRQSGYVPSKSWGTKVHIVTYPEMSGRELKALAKTVIHHNHGFNALAWDLKNRDVDQNAPSLVWIPSLSNLSDRSTMILDRLDAAQSTEVIAWLMNTDPNGKGHLRPWNFWPVVAAQSGPIVTPYYEGHQFTNLVEYNLAPGSATPEDATMWIDLACLFVRGALKHNARWRGGTPKGPDPNLFREGDLSKFVLEEAEDAGLSVIEHARLEERLAFLTKSDS